jgi:hypothetical protein
VSRATARRAACAALALAATAAGHGSAHGSPDLSAYRGPGTWVDIFDAGVMKRPETAVAKMSARGVGTLYLETANYRTAPRRRIANRVATARLIDAAHAAGIRVVAWYLPGFRKLGRDLRRSLGAIGFATPNGQRFDSFALDIEANLVSSIAGRNRALLRLSRRIRAAVGPDYPLAAIVPDSRSTSVFLPSLWPGFPYAKLRPLYDVFVPMAYSTYRGRGSRFVYRYTRDNVEYLRGQTGDPSLPVHVIGGLASGLRAREDLAVVRAAADTGAIGTSFYKFAWSGLGEWRALRPLP